MSAVLHHALLVLAAVAMADAGARAAARFAPRGLERLLSAAALAVAAIVLEALLLGLLGLADEPVVLAGAAVATGVAGRLLLPDPPIGVVAEGAARWREADQATRAAVGAGVLLWAGWTAWQLRHPFVATDGLTYHLPLASEWAQDGHPGRIVGAIAGVPVANYPVTNEVVVAWGIAISRGWTVASVWTPLLVLLALAGGWRGLRALRVPAWAAGLALLAYAAQPILLTQVGGPLTDVACAAWAICAAGLCAVAAAERRPALLAPALVAAGLSFGTKTTGSFLLVVALGAAVWACRDTLRPALRAVLPVLPLALAAGAVWVTRNLVDHGSPLWPFVSTSFGDPIPPAFAKVDASFLSHPKTMLDGRVDDYITLLSGGTVLLVGLLVAPLAAWRSRAVKVAAGVAAIAVVVWASAPYTGITTSTQLAVGAVRYLLPALAACTLTLALAARDAGRTGRAFVGAWLAWAAVASLVRTWQLGFPFVPSAGTLVAAGVVGAIAGLLAPPAVRVRPPAALAGAAGLAVLVAVGLAAASNGYVDRHMDSGLGDAGLLKAVAATGGDRPVAMGPATNALVRGDHLERRVVFLDGSEACAAVRGDLARGPLVVQTAPRSAEADALTRCLRGIPSRWHDARYTLYG